LSPTNSEHETPKARLKVRDRKLRASGPTHRERLRICCRFGTRIPGARDARKQPISKIPAVSGRGPEAGFARLAGIPLLIPFRG